MKRPYLIVILLLLNLFVYSQNPINSKVRKIEVVGYAYEEVSPNAVYISFVLKEYKDENGKIVTINESEKQIRGMIEKLNCKKNTLNIGNIYGYLDSEDKNSTEVFKHKIQYILKVESLVCAHKFLEKVDKKAIESFNIDGENYENSDSLNRAIQTKAFKKAKEKAEKLLAVYDEKCGEVLEIEEIFGSLTTPDLSGKGAVSKRLNFDSGITYDSNSNVVSNLIRVEYMVKVTFAIE